MTIQLEGTFDWTSDEIKVDNRLIFRGGEAARIAVLSPKVSVTASHYIKAANSDRATIHRCLKLDGKPCPLCTPANQPRTRFGCVVLLYYEEGEKFDWEILPWLFGKDKFVLLKALAKKGVDFSKTDILARCHNEKFQNVRLEVASGCKWREDPKVVADVIAYLKENPMDILAMLKASNEDFEPAEVKARTTRTNQRTVTEVKAAAGKVGLGSDDLSLFDENEAAETSLNELANDQKTTAPTAAAPAQSGDMTADIESLLGDLNL